MPAKIKTRIKICCIQSIEEAQMAIASGASVIGLVSEMPSGPGVISEELIENIAISTPPTIATFLLTSKKNVDEIFSRQKRYKANTIQICNRLTEGSHKGPKSSSNMSLISRIISPGL